MTVPASASRRVTYTATGSTTGPFAVTFPFFEIAIYLDEVLVEPTEYTISQASPGTTGNITFDVAPVGDLVILGATNRAQGIDFISSDTVEPAEAERGLDRLTMIAQEIETALTGTLRVDVGVSSNPGPIDLGLVEEKLIVTKDDGGIKVTEAVAGYVKVDDDGVVSTVSVVGAGELGAVVLESPDATILDQTTAVLVVPVGSDAAAVSQTYVDTQDAGLDARIDALELGGGGGGGTTNLTYTASPTNGIVVSSTGTDATIPVVDGTNAGLMAPAQHTKLAGIATGATANLGDVVGPASSVDYENAVFSGTTGKLLRSGGLVTLTPRMFGATGSGTETAALQSLFAAHASTSGSEIVIDRPYTIAGQLTYTADNLRLRFERDGELILTGSSSLYGAVHLGTAPTGLTSRTLSANAARGVTALTWNDATGMDVGHIIRLTYTGPHTVQQSFCAKIVAKSSNTIYLSHPLPWDLTTATTFVSVTSGASMSGAVIENFNARASGFSGAALTALRMMNCDGIRVYGSKTTGMISGGILVNGCVDPAVYDHLGINDGATTSDAAFPVYAMSGGILSNITIRGSDYFGFNLDYVHHARLEKLTASDLGEVGAYVRGLKLWDCSSNVITDVNLTDVVGQGSSFQNGVRDNFISNWRIAGMIEGVVLGSPYPAQGITTNGTGNTNNIWVNVACLGTPTADGGTDIAIAAGDTGQVFLGLDYDTISNNEPNTTTIIRRNGAMSGPNAPLGWKTIAVSGQSDVVSDSTNDTLTLVAGSNVTITTNAGTDTITIASAGGSGSTNLAYTASPTNGIVTSDSGTDATLPLVDGTNAGLMAPAQHTKLAGIETGATADQTGAEIVSAIDTQLGSSTWQSGAGSVATDAIFDVKGDLPVGTGANTAARLAVGTNGQVLTADSAEATGLKWSTVSGSGDVTAASNFGTDNRLIRSDGTTKGVQASGITVDDTDNVTGVASIDVTVAGGVKVGGVKTLDADGTGTYTRLSDTEGTNKLILGDSADPVSYHSNGLHRMRSANAADTFVEFNSSGINLPSGKVIELGHASDTTVSRTSAGVMAVEGETVHTNSISRTVTAAGVELGHATDTTLTRSAAGVLAVEGVPVVMTGKKTIWLPASSFKARATSGAGSVDYDSGSSDVSLTGWGFDTTTQEYIHSIPLGMAKSWNEGTVTAIIYWTNTGGASAETVRFTVAAVAVSDDDTLNATFGTAQNCDDTWLAQNDLHITAESSAITIGGTPAENDLVVLQVSRDVANDTMAGDAVFIGMKLLVTTNAGTDA